MRWSSTPETRGVSSAAPSVCESGGRSSGQRPGKAILFGPKVASISLSLWPIRKILTHLGEPLEPPLLSPARGPPTDWGELVQAHDDREAVQVSADDLPVIDIHSL
jgi:hypothetical protein